LLNRNKNKENFVSEEEIKDNVNFSSLRNNYKLKTVFQIPKLCRNNVNKVERLPSIKSEREKSFKQRREYDLNVDMKKLFKIMN